MVVVCETCAYEVLTAIRVYYHATVLAMCLRLNIYCCHGDGSDGRHVCSKYRGHLHYNQATEANLLLSFCCCHGDGSDGCVYKVSLP